MSFQLKQSATLSQNALIIKINKIKIFILNLYYNNKDKLKSYLVQIKLYVKRYRDQFREFEN